MDVVVISALVDATILGGLGIILINISQVFLANFPSGGCMVILKIIRVHVHVVDHDERT